PKAGSHTRAENGCADLLDVFHSRQRKYDAPSNRNASSDVPVAGAACRHWNLVFVRKTQDGRHRLRAPRQRDRIRWISGKPFVPGILLTKGWIEFELAPRQFPLEPFQRLLPPRLHGTE